MISLFKNHPLLKIFSNSLIYLPSPLNINTFWNMGSLLGLCLMIQIFTGLFLSMFFISSTDYAFNSVDRIMREVNLGWMFRMIHMNGASLFFIACYTHMLRGIYYMSYKLWETWTIGVIILIMLMATAFMGYVLPWGQMSFWGATVITNFFSVVPYMGPNLVNLIWGGFSVDFPTLNRFFAFHFLLPFIISMMVIIHLIMLHQTGSNNPLGIKSNLNKVMFHPYFSSKDMWFYLLVMTIFFSIIMFNPWYLMDPENFIKANSMVTPIHIQPEWYFLFSYAILRSIPNKLGGVIALMLSIMIFFIFPMMNMNKLMSSMFLPMQKIMFWIFVSSLIILTWSGKSPVLPNIITIGQITTMLYFSLLLIYNISPRIIYYMMKF